MFRIAILVCKFLRSGSLILSVSVIMALGRVTQINWPNSSTFPLFPLQNQSNILVIVLPLMLQRFGMTYRTMYIMQLQLPPLGKSSKLVCWQKPIHLSHTSARIFSGMIFANRPMIILYVYVYVLESVKWWIFHLIVTMPCDYDFLIDWFDNKFVPQLSYPWS